MGLDVDVVVTDRCPSIKTLMSKEEEYQFLEHQFDIWHTAKGWLYSWRVYLHFYNTKLMCLAQSCIPFSLSRYLIIVAAHM